ncbi:MAG: hypothetical protein COV67_13740 [Nitrospinae bacterium CG11_big_fil_rev_8_21_14_0_20_56_8]|nr:MAG: hypothetical protein COV67_13740 [Nitrospinae bacterium CG11_big_fil_rev_8_21_14_0_20_56_8]
MTFRFLVSLFFLLYIPLVSLPAYAAVEEEWLGTYFQGKKLGFTQVRTDSGPAEVTVDSRVHIRMEMQGLDQSTTFTQSTVLDPENRLLRFSLVQEIMGNRQKVDGRIEGDTLVYRVVATGFDREKSIPFPPGAAPSATYLLNLARDGLKTGKKGKISIFMESFQVMSELEYEVLREEDVESLGQTHHAFVLLQRLSGMESTLWLTAEGLMLKEVVASGFESVRETGAAAIDLGKEPLSVSHLITLSLVKPRGEMVRPETQRRLTLALSNIRSPELLPQDRRQRVVETGRQADGAFRLVLNVATEPPAPARIVPFPVPAPEEGAAAFLGESPHVQSNHPLIRALSREVTGKDKKDAWAAALKINRWVYENLEKVLVDSVTALDALKNRRGECQSHTYLFTALARAAGIPARVVNGLVFSKEYGGFLYHAWPEVYVGEWRALDPTLGQDAVDATHVKLSGDEEETPLKLMEFIGRVGIDLIEK